MTEIAKPSTNHDAISAGDEWILREAAGNPQLISLIGAREAEIQHVNETGMTTVQEQQHLREIVDAIAEEKASMGINNTLHPEVDYGVIGEDSNSNTPIAPPQHTDK